MWLGLTNTIPNIVNLPGQGGEPAYGPEAFVTKWRVSSGDTIQLPEASIGIPPALDYDVDWGDGNEDLNVNIADKTHTYTFGGGGTKDFTVIITRDFYSLDMSRATTAQRSYLVEMIQWGTDHVWASVVKMFKSCKNMVYSATDAPDLTSLAAGEKRADKMFSQCESITSLDLTGWNIINIKGLTEMFFGMINCTEINLSNWTTKNVETTSKFCSEVGNSTNGCNFIMPNLWWRNCTVMDDAFASSYIDSIDVSGWEFDSSLTLDRLFESTKKGSATGTFDIDLSTWVGTSNMTSMSQFFQQCRASSVNATNLDTSNVTNMYQFAYQSEITHITGLDTFNSSSLVSASPTSLDGVVDFFRDCWLYDFDQPNANFGANWGPNFNPGLLSLMRFFKSCGGTGANPPNVSDWSVSNIQRFDLMFSHADWSSTNNPDVSLWDVSSATSFNEFARRSKVSALDTSNWEISNNCTTMWGFVEESDFNGTLDFSNVNCDFSSVWSFNGFANGVNLTGLKLHATSNFGSCGNFTNFANGPTPLSTTDYDYFLDRLAATGVAVPLTLDMGIATYTIATAGAYHTYLTGTLGWIINDNGGI